MCDAAGLVVLLPGNICCSPVHTQREETKAKKLKLLEEKRQRIEEEKLRKK